MKILTDIEHLEGVKVMVRVDFNVPVKNGVVMDDYRIKTALSTIDFLRSKGAKIILITHLEKAEGMKSTTEKGVPTVKPVVDHLVRLGLPITFIDNYYNGHEFINNQLKNGEMVLFENLRSQEGEKANDEKFAKGLASLADIYINEAFPVSHRKHASVVGIPKFLPSYAGLQFEKEVAHLSRAFNPAHPFLFILSGAKFETKLPLIEKFIHSADSIFIGGALANNIYKERGYETGQSVVSKMDIDISQFVNNAKVIVPTDIVNQNKEVKAAESMNKDDQNMDAGPNTIAYLKEKIAESKLVLWNGPLGLYERGFTEPTLELANIIAEATSRGAETIVGGGDTVAAIATQGLQDKFTFVSTGGGAMLDFLAKGTLPGIEALK